MRKLLKILDSDKTFEVNNVYCIGKNYDDHIKEMSNDYVPEAPIIFLKPGSSVISGNSKIIIPEIDGNKISENLQHEVEIILLIGTDGYKIKKENACKYIEGYGIGLDMTLRDIQTNVKQKGLPWCISKGFYTSAPVSDFILLKNKDIIDNTNFCLKLNDEIVQKGNTGKMIHKIPDLIEYISNIFYLKKGDIIFTGTPSGVSKVKSGDKLKAYIEEKLMLETEIE